jgi:hypothetical protein
MERGGWRVYHHRLNSPDLKIRLYYGCFWRSQDSRDAFGDIKVIWPISDLSSINGAVYSFSNIPSL